MKKYVWTLPTVLMFVTTVLVVFLQGCGVVKIDKIHALPTTQELDKQLQAITWGYGLILVTGAIFCAYIYSAMKTLDSKIDKLADDRG